MGVGQTQHSTSRVQLPPSTFHTEWCSGQSLQTVLTLCQCASCSSV